jgi:hypothetical protein
MFLKMFQNHLAIQQIRSYQTYQQRKPTGWLLSFDEMLCKCMGHLFRWLGWNSKRVRKVTSSMLCAINYWCLCLPYFQIDD